MLKSLNEIKVIKKENKELWLKYLYETSEKKYNILNVKSLKEITKHSVFNYVLRTLEILDRLKNELNLEDDIIYYVEETLKWSDVSKTGDKKTRSMWKKKKYDLFCHNIASAQIYLENNTDEIVYTLIKTHGLVGQNIKGEVNLNKNIELYNLIKEGKISSEKLKTILLVLNQCIIEGVSEELYISIKKKVEYTIEKIINGEFDEELLDTTKMMLVNALKNSYKLTEDLSTVVNMNDNFYGNGTIDHTVSGHVTGQTLAESGPKTLSFRIFLY